LQAFAWQVPAGLQAAGAHVGPAQVLVVLHGCASQVAAVPLQVFMTQLLPVLHTGAPLQVCVVTQVGDPLHGFVVTQVPGLHTGDAPNAAQSVDTFPAVQCVYGGGGKNDTDIPPPGVADARSTKT